MFSGGHTFIAHIYLPHPEQWLERSLQCYSCLRFLSDAVALPLLPARSSLVLFFLFVFLTEKNVISCIMFQTSLYSARHAPSTFDQEDIAFFQLDWLDGLTAQDRWDKENSNKIKRLCF